MSSTLIAFAATALHVVNYNATAQIEFSTRCITKVLGRNAIYYYTVYLILSALLRDHLISTALADTEGSLPVLPDSVSLYLGIVLLALGIGLNIWTFQALGIKGMYNGDSFGWLMDSIVESGPFVYFDNPQYVGTTLSMLASAIFYQSLTGYALTVWMGVCFYVSVVYVEGPHMHRIYSNRASSSLYSQSDKGKSS